MTDTRDLQSHGVNQLKSMKSLLLAVLMVSMSLSVGLVELNKAPWLVEDADSELGEDDTPMQTSAPSISYSSSTLALSNNTAMTPLTVTNSGGALGVPVAVDLSGIGEWLDVALDSDGYRHVSAADSSNLDLMYATDTSGAWVNITVDAPGQAGKYTQSLLILKTSYILPTSALRMIRTQIRKTSSTLRAHHHAHQHLHGQTSPLTPLVL